MGETNRAPLRTKEHVKTEFSVFLRTPPTKERTDTFVSLFFCFSSIIEFLLGTQGVISFKERFWFSLYNQLYTDSPILSTK
jgi:hypothetical protein